METRQLKLECLKLANGDVILAKEYFRFVDDVSINGGYSGYMSIYNDYKDIFDKAMNCRSQNYSTTQTASRWYNTNTNVDIPPENISYNDKEEKEHIIENDNFIKQEFKDAW
tara:strand:+ start:50 stop:385 length:336 start_codon:yes stop_codon:yes gene_type:complete